MFLPVLFVDGNWLVIGKPHLFSRQRIGNWLSAAVLRKIELS
jgi:hypothetical protein